MTKPPRELQIARHYMRLQNLIDAEAIYQNFIQDEQMTIYLIWPPRPSIEITREFIRRCIRVWEEKSAFP